MKRGNITDMTKLEQKLLPIARKWAGNIPVWEAKEAGVEPSTLRHWAKNNPDVENGTRGVYVWYSDDDEIDWDVCETARYLAKAGKDAFLWGPSVLEFMEIGDVGAPGFYIAVPTRRYPQLSVKWVVTKKRTRSKYKGMPVQSLKSAIAVSMPLLDADKRQTVLDDAEKRYPKIKDFLGKVCAEYGINRERYNV